MANLLDNMKTNMAAIVNKAYCWKWHILKIMSINYLISRIINSYIIIITNYTIISNNYECTLNLN